MNIKIVMEQVAGIEPASIPWQGIVLPINYTCGWSGEGCCLLAL